jgi:plasmid stabilization system protein ParE
LLPAAKVDLQEAYDWYAARSARAALLFELAADHALHQVAQNPELSARCDARHRLHRIRRYPYSIIYRIEPGTVLVVAVAHGRRRPGYWRNRK